MCSSMHIMSMLWSIAPFLPAWRTMRFGQVVWVLVKVIFRWLFLFSAIEVSLSLRRATKNYWDITLTFIAAKIELKIENILRKNQNGFRGNRSTTSRILTIRRILEGVRAKNLAATILFVDFTKAFDFIHRGKMEQIPLSYVLPKETVAAIMMRYRNTKVKARSPTSTL